MSPAEEQGGAANPRGGGRRRPEPYVCPNGHPFQGVYAVTCDQCNAKIVVEPVARGLDLHERLNRALALVTAGIIEIEHLAPYAPPEEHKRARATAAELRELRNEL